ncbi:MAG: GntR family transcriptional regulator, partial [Eubacterium sp.]|nr:GntR family transcriptional regulator [Eubacterium sp.]
DKRPIYEQIVDKLTNLILRGVYEADEKLPSVRSMAVDLSINPNTIQRAYGELERQGYIYSIKGRGNFVRSMEDLVLRKKEKALEGLQSILTECKGIGIPEEEVRNLVRKVYQGGAS